MTKETLCPLCDTPMEYRMIPARDSYLQHDTHAYICPDCPFIGFEYYFPNNYQDLKKLIK